MPIYEYECQACGKAFDKFVRSITTEVEVECPECHSKECRKRISLFGTTQTGAGTLSSVASCAPSGG